jgi:hypothetical protein
LAVAVTSSRTTAASSTKIAGLTSPVSACISGTTVTSTGPLLPNTAIVTGPRSGMERPRAVPSAAACSTVAPGRSRPIAWKIET